MENEQQLSENIEKLTKQVVSSNSLWGNLKRGIFWGIGSALGASIIAAIILGIIAKITESFKKIPAIFQ